MITQKELKNKLIPLLKEHGMVYKKIKEVYARKAREGEIIKTKTGDGLETINKAKKGDFIIQNQTSNKEEYIISASKLHQKYRLHKILENGYLEFHPTGKIIAVQLDATVLQKLELDNPFYFKAPWDSEMIAKKGDFLVAPLDFSEIYRIAQQEFAETYCLDD